jgi:hypothetical protein
MAWPARERALALIAAVVPMLLLPAPVGVVVSAASSGPPSSSPMPVSLRPISIPDTRIISMSPDGRLLAAARPAAAYLNGHLCTYDVATLAERACADLSGLRAGFDIGSVRWSPDGSKLVFAENVFRSFVDGDLWLMDAATGSLTNLDDDHADGRLLPRGAGQTPSGDFTLPVSPTFTPDGTHVTYSRSLMRGGRQAGNEIATVAADGGEPRQLLAVSTERIGVVSGGMAWSPDGRTLYFTRIHPDAHDPSAGIWAVGSDGGGLRRILGADDPELGAPSLLQVSPAGDRLLAFYRDAAASPLLRPAYALVDVATGAATPLLVSGETQPPLAAVGWAGFSPDGSWLVETTRLEHRVLLRNVDDGRELPLVPEGLPNAAPIEFGLAPTWASDGTILLTGGGAFETATLLTMARPGASPAPVPSPAASSLASRSGSSADDAKRVVLRMTVSGGFVPVEVVDTTLPAFTLYADGSVIFRPLPAPWPTPAGPLPPLQHAQLDAQQVGELLAFALGPGGLREAREQYYDPTVMDARFTILDVDVPGLTKQVSVYALGLDEQAPDGVERTRFAALADRLGSFDQQTAAGQGSLVGDYRPGRYRGILRPVSPGPSQPARPWPFVDLGPAAFVGTGSARYAELRPDQVALVAPVPNAGVTDIRLDTPDGFDTLLTIRPLLPDEAAVPVGAASVSWPVRAGRSRRRAGRPDSGRARQNVLTVVRLRSPAGLPGERLDVAVRETLHIGAR